MDDKIRLMIEGEIDLIIKDPSKFRELVEGMGVEPTDEGIIAYFSGYLVGRAIQFYIDTGRKFKRKDKNSLKFYEELEKLIGRRAGEMRNAFWR